MKKTQTNSQSNQRHSTDNSTSYNSSFEEPKKYTFKTNVMETEHKNPIEVPKREPPAKGTPGYRMTLAEMQRSKSLPEFQRELHAATQRLRISRLGNEKENTKMPPKHNVPTNNNDRHKDNNNLANSSKVSNVKDSSNQKLKTLDTKKDPTKYKPRQNDSNSKSTKTKQEHKINKPATDNAAKMSNNNKKKFEMSTQTSFSKEKSLPNIRKKSETKEQQPAKTFYFGMEETNSFSNNNNNNNSNNNIVDSFASSFQTQQLLQNFSGSDLSSEIEVEDGQISTNGIALNLRPILPKKQLEIPRFSPAAAWRLLSALESNPAPSTVSDEGPVFIEDRIEKCARQPPLLSLLQTGPRSNHDKSGDSGISGDAGPPAFDDSGEALMNPGARNMQVIFN